jgi:hypothetical protein
MDIMQQQDNRLDQSEYSRRQVQIAPQVMRSPMDGPKEEIECLEGIEEERYDEIH